MQQTGKPEDMIYFFSDSVLNCSMFDIAGLIRDEQT